MNYADIVRTFGFPVDPAAPPQSIYPYAPVFRLRNADGEWIVKRTRTPLAHALAVAQWTRSLARHGIGVVTPAPGFEPNPRSLPAADGDEQAWVVYPFIAGSAYAGALRDIHAAGALLGRIHAAGMDDDCGLKLSPTVVPIEADELAQDRDTIGRLVSRAFPQHALAARALLAERTQRYVHQALPRMLALRLPLTNASWDYKAVNLVYAPGGAPVLVDPDNGGRIPRLYDLAIALLLFHNDGAGPGRIFSTPEWLAFLAGYAEHIRLTDDEVRAWDDLLLCAWIDEALWLLREDEAGWHDGRQSGMLLSLLTAPLAAFAVRP